MGNDGVSTTFAHDPTERSGEISAPIADITSVQLELKETVAVIAENVAAVAKTATSTGVSKEWQDAIDMLTDCSLSSLVGLRAARYIEKVRRRTGDGPTYSELLGHLWPEQGGIPSPLPEDLTKTKQRELREYFRRRVSSGLQRSGWILATSRSRSLRTGPRYRVPNSRSSGAIDGL